MCSICHLDAYVVPQTGITRIRNLDADQKSRVTPFRGYSEYSTAQTEDSSTVRPLCGRMKYIIVTGGVLSGLGKGITTASIGRLLKSRGYKVTALKIDPYLNCDAGTMNPYQHGEVFVLDDGGEVDLDLGHYERFLDINLRRENNLTTGMVYKAVIERERRGDYLGQTVQIIPHVTDEIKRRIRDVAGRSKADVLLIELGGTVGDIESMPFLEAVRQLRNDVGHSNVAFVHATLVPTLAPVGEQKTKPTQHSVSTLRGIGIQPDLIIGRGSKPLTKEVRRKIALFCDVPPEAVISVPDLGSIYQVPLVLESQGLSDYLGRCLGLSARVEDLLQWRAFVDQVLGSKKAIKIGVVGKYTQLTDAYLSYTEALHHAGAAEGVRVDISWMEAETLEEGGAEKILSQVGGVVVPGGFGSRGAGGKIEAIKYCRDKGIPFLGLCFGFQLAVVEFCRSVLDLEGADSAEVDPHTTYPVIDLLPEQKTVAEMGGTMRLGAQPVVIDKGSRAYQLYGKTNIEERHRHRYEVNPEYIEQIERGGLRFSGRSPDGRRMEIAEIADHPFFIASQFHPEFKSRPGKPSPLYRGLVRAVMGYR